MPAVIEISSTRLNAQCHAEVALSLAQGKSAKVDRAGTECLPTAVKPVGWSEPAADWLDTPPLHCSPLDDY